MQYGQFCLHLQYRDELKDVIHKYCILFLSQKSKTLHRDDVYAIFPGIYANVEMVPDSVGDWLLHCHVNNHLTGGMETLFSVMTPTSKSSLLETRVLPACLIQPHCLRRVLYSRTKPT